MNSITAQNASREIGNVFDQWNANNDGIDASDEMIALIIDKHLLKERELAKKLVQQLRAYQKRLQTNKEFISSDLIENAIKAYEAILHE